MQILSCIVLIKLQNIPAFQARNIRRMLKCKTLKKQDQKQEENGVAEIEEIREDNIEAAERQESKTNLMKK